MDADNPQLLLVAALLALLRDALDDADVAHLADARLRTDLRGLGARVDRELAGAPAEPRLHLA